MYRQVNNYSSNSKLEEHISVLPTFSDVLVNYYFKKNGIFDGGIFERVTLISRNVYKKLCDDKNYIPDERLAYTICISIGLNLGETCELLSLANMSIIPKDGTDGYREMLVGFLVNRKKNIRTCNQLLKEAGYNDKEHLLGSLRSDCSLSLDN